MKKIFAALFLAVFVVNICPTISLGADDAVLSMEELLFLEIPVVIASGKSEKVSDAPANVYVITGKEMQKRGYRTLVDLFKDLPGTTYLDIYGYAVGGTPVIRGFLDSARFKLLINGNWVDPHTGWGNANGERYPVAGIKRVEFIVGPYASLYGRNTFTGVMNIVTKDGQDVDAVQTDLTYGKYGQMTAQVIYGKKINELDVFLSLYKNLNQDGWQIADDYEEYTDAYREANAPSGNSLANANSDFKLKWDATDLYLKLAHENGLTFDISHNFYINPKVGTGLIQTRYAQDDDTVTNDTLTTARLQYEKDLNDALKSKSVLSYHYYDWDAKNVYLSGWIRRYRIRATGYTVEENLRYNVSDNNELFAGITYETLQNKTLVHELAAYGTEPDTPEWTDDKIYDEKYITITLQDEIKLSDKMQVVAGVMYEIEEKFADVLVPRLSLLYSLSEDTKVKFLYGGGYLTPDPLKTGDQSTVKGNPDIKPEYLTSYDLNLIHSLSANSHIVASVFYNQVDDMINQVSNVIAGTSFTTTWKNIGKKKSMGFEISPDVQLSEKVKAFASFAYVDGSHDIVDSNGNITTNEWLPASSKQHAKIGANILLLQDKLNLYVYDLYTGEQTGWVETTNLDGYNRVDINLMTTSEFNPDLVLSLGITNLLDTQIWQPPLRNASTSGNVPNHLRRFTFRVSKKW